MLLALAVAAPVSADKPVLWYDHDVEETWEVVDCIDYGFDFTVYDHDIYHESEMAYYDDTGLWVKTLYQKHGTDNLYNENKPDYVFSGSYNIRAYADIVTQDPHVWTVKISGSILNVEIPGHGTVIHQSGQQVWLVQDWNWTDMLKQKGLNKFDFATLCAALQ
jgi:hypothetical protein